MNKLFLLFVCRLILSVFDVDASRRFGRKQRRSSTYLKIVCVSCLQIYELFPLFSLKQEFLPVFDVNTLREPAIYDLPAAEVKDFILSIEF